MRKFINGLVWGSMAGPEIVIDWENRKVELRRMSPRLGRRILRWMSW